MPFCRYCGSKSPDDALFCRGCGRQLTLLTEGQTNISGPLPATSSSWHASPTVSGPLPVPPINQQKEDEQQHWIIPPSQPLPGQAPTGNVPVVQGTPQMSNIPIVQGTPTVPAPSLAPQAGTFRSPSRQLASHAAKGGASSASKMAVGPVAKLVLIAVTIIAVAAGGAKILPIVLHGGNTSPNGSSPVLTTKPVPPTQTSCPTAGTARAAVTAPLVLGSHQNIVYVKKIESANNTPISSMLYRYDVTTHQTTQILQIENADIADAQVSANGQWVIFLSEVGGSPAIQMVRMDGQGLQTLYCMPTTQYSYQRTILDILVSPDQKQLAFVTGLDQDQATFSLLNMTNGTVQAALQPHPGFTLYQPVMWLNDTQLYLWRYPVMQSALFLLNTQNGPDQPSNILTDVADFPSLEDFDVSPDRTKLFIGLCQVCGQGIFVGPSSISVQPATATVRHIIYDPKGAIMALLAAPNNTLLFGINSYSQTPSVPADTSQNGIWKINVDGSGLSRLFSGSISFAIESHQDISNDGEWYLLSSNSGLLFASLNGGAPVQFTPVANTTGISFVAAGWTTL